MYFKSKKKVQEFINNKLNIVLSEDGTPNITTDAISFSYDDVSIENNKNNPHEPLIESIIGNNSIEDTKLLKYLDKYSDNLTLILEKVIKTVDKPEKELKVTQGLIMDSNKNLLESINSLKDEIKTVSEGQLEIIALLAIKPKRLIPKLVDGKIESIDIEWQNLIK